MAASRASGYVASGGHDERSAASTATAIHYQYTDTAAGTFWCGTHLEADRDPSHAITVGVSFEEARHFRGRDTDRHSVSRCPGGDCCRAPHADLALRWDGIAYPAVLTGITQAMVVEAPRIAEALPSLFEFIDDAVVVGHNVRFDLSFINAAAERLGYGQLPDRSVDTVALARRLVRSEVRNLKLSTLASYFRSPVTPDHRALTDATATAHVLWGLLERAGSIGVTHLDDLLRLPTARGTPHYEKIHLTDALPRRTGVYLFRDRNDRVIYVGKARATCGHGCGRISTAIAVGGSETSCVNCAASSTASALRSSRPK